MRPETVTLESTSPKIDDTLKRKKLSINYGKSKFLVVGNAHFRKKTLKEFEKNPLKM